MKNKFSFDVSEITENPMKYFFDDIICVGVSVGEFSLRCALSAFHSF